MRMSISLVFERQWSASLRVVAAPAYLRSPLLMSESACGLARADHLGMFGVVTMHSEQMLKTFCLSFLLHRCHALTVSHSDAHSLKAYKLGKRRWSYNQCQLVIQQEDGEEQLSVLEAMANGQEGLNEEHEVRLGVISPLWYVEHIAIR